MSEVLTKSPPWQEPRRAYLEKHGACYCNAWQSGYDAYREGRPYASNAFSGERAGSREYWYAWREGWMTAADQADVVRVKDEDLWVELGDRRAQ